MNQLSYCHRICNDKSEESCTHSSDEVLDFAGAAEIKAKIHCSSFCEELKQKILEKIKEVREISNSLFDESVEKINQRIDIHNQTVDILEKIQPDQWQDLVNPLLKDPQVQKVNSMLNNTY